MELTRFTCCDWPPREANALGLRDLQVAQERRGRGIGTWAVQQAQAFAATRGFLRLQAEYTRKHVDVVCSLGVRDRVRLLVAR
ncbi:GNAT family N-acetyltransferase [Pseudoxanthomonas mexicana]